MNDYTALTEVARARYKLACDEMDRLTAGSPGTNWRWSIPANPDRDSDLILSASAEDVPRLADAVEALMAENTRLESELADADAHAQVNAMDYAYYVQMRAERDALRAENEKPQPAYEFTGESESLQNMLEAEQEEGRVLRNKVRNQDAQIVTLQGQVRALHRERDALRAQLDKVRAARAAHPKCDIHYGGDPVKCGWKRVVLDVDAALEESADE